MDSAVFTDIVIPFSRKKLVLILLSSLFLLLTAGYYLIKGGLTIGDRTYYNIALTVLSAISLVIVPITNFNFLLKLMKKEGGLIIGQEGIIDNTSTLSIGEIKWEDIQYLSINQRLIMVHVNNPEAYIARQSNKIKRGVMTNFNRSYGTPLSITVAALDISFDKLLGMLNEHLALRTARTISEPQN